MKKIKRILSTLLAVTLLLSALSCLSVLQVSAASTTDIGSTDPADIEDYPVTVYKTPEEKLATMKVMSENASYRLYVDSASGEVAAYEKATGNILFTNPYDVASDKSQSTVKAQLLSQITISYKDKTGATSDLYSYTDAALNDQISVQKIKNGVRVEYIIGREDTRKMVPKLILADSFEPNILEPLQEMVAVGEITEIDYEIFLNRWQKLDLNEMRKIVQLSYVQAYPFVNDYKTQNENGEDVYPIFYVFREESVNGSQLLQCEEYIKSYTDYSFEQMDADHEATGYESTDVTYPVFRLALEYYLDENGMYVQMPCNGLRYDMEKYTLENISILPYIGAGSNANAGYVYKNGDTTLKTEGYTFFPDGAGALFDYEELNTTSVLKIPGKLYGEDYAYQELFGIKNQKILRYPVYGSVSSEVIHEYTYLDKSGVEQTVRVSNTVKTADKVKAEIQALKENGATILNEQIGENANVYQRGYAAFIMEGDSFAELQLLHGGSLHGYNTILNFFNPKPNDTYNLSDAISVAGNTSMTVVSDRKYTGNISIRFVMLCDENIAQEAKSTTPTYTHYGTSWLGMAEAYRDYLCRNGVLSRLEEEDVEENIPLYIEVFGALETQQTIATIPVNLMTPLTTFDNMMEMYQNLSQAGIKNINFKMTGFANGGMYYTVPSALNWENAVGGKDGFKNLVNQANTINQEGNAHLGLYPDFDFAYIQKNELFDATVLKDDAVKTVDNRYSSYRQYSATQQTFVSLYQLAISPSRYSKFYTKLLSNYEQYGLKSLSVASLGHALNSDFDEEDSYTREDSKDYTMQALSYIKNQGYSIMTDSGNAYTWGYVDHILNVDLDSSRYLKSCASVPFIGTVLHGYVQFAGTPLNEEGDADYAVLRAIENGAGMYFLLSYQNTGELKKDSYLSQYYSIRYDIWMDDVVSYYNQLNGLLKNLQTSLIVDHAFLIGERVLEMDELAADIAAKLEAAKKLEDAAQKEKETAELIAIADAWALAYGANSTMAELVNDMKTINAGISAFGDQATLLEFSAEMTAVLEAIKTVAPYKSALEASQAQLDALKESENPNEDEIAALEEQIRTETSAYETANRGLTKAQAALTDKIGTLRDYTATMVNYAVQAKNLYEKANRFSQELAEAVQLITNTSIYDNDEVTRAALLDQILEGKSIVDEILPELQSLYNVYGDRLNTESDSYVGTVAVNALHAAFYTAFEEGGSYVAYADYQETLLEMYQTILFDAKDVENMIESDSEADSDDVTADDSEDDTYVVDNNRIVLVVYGDRDETTHEKTTSVGFILNYNTFAVRVTYGDTVYTIPSGGYVVIENLNA